MFIAPGSPKAAYHISIQTSCLQITPGIELYSCVASKTIPLYAPNHSSFSAAAFFALTPRIFFSGASFFGRCACRRADARETASARRSDRYPNFAVLLAIPL
jgi:hypothetical protein